jgi:hypothetical protein
MSAIQTDFRSTIVDKTLNFDKYYYSASFEEVKKTSWKGFKIFLAILFNPSYKNNFSLNSFAGRVNHFLNENRQFLDTLSAEELGMCRANLVSLQDKLNTLKNKHTISDLEQCTTDVTVLRNNKNREKDIADLNECQQILNLAEKSTRDSFLGRPEVAKLSKKIGIENVKYAYSQSPADPEENFDAERNFNKFKVAAEKVQRDYSNLNNALLEKIRSSGKDMGKILKKVFPEHGDKKDLVNDLKNGFVHFDDAKKEKLYQLLQNS